MKLTNIHNLPEALYNIMIKNIYQPIDSQMRVTELINAPLVKELMIKHWKELTEDVSDGLWKLLGTSCHYILKGGTPEDALGEEKLSFTIGDITITGQSDLYSEQGIEDWKVTSVFSFLLGVKKNWIAQLNVYKWLWERNGFPVKSLKINAILRDWQRSKAKYDPAYPQIPFLSFDVPMWYNSIITEYIFDRIVEHTTKPARECSDEEKWTRPTTWAVMEEGKKRAKRVLDTEEKAMKWLEDNSDFYVENLEGLYLVMKKGLKKPKEEFMTKEEASDYIKEKETLYVVKRKGINVKCENFCLVNKVCPYYIREVK